MVPTSHYPVNRLQAREAKAKKKAQQDRYHDRYVQKTYGLSAGEYAARLAEQDGRCAICTRRPIRRRLAVDHDHETNAIRGLLCYHCNHEVIGRVEFDPIAVYNLIQYLQGILDAHPLPEPGLPEVFPLEAERPQELALPDGNT